MPFVCEISGETSSSGSDGGFVVTPSGHICLRRLLLQKLTENGGLDPFETTSSGAPRPLSEDDLIELKETSQNALVPPRPATSLNGLMSQLQQEYHAVVLELFDTRKLLEETRQELSQALYQNDAATRVIARLSMERDAARHQLEEQGGGVLRTGGPSGGSAHPPTQPPQTVPADEPGPSEEEESTGRPRKKSKLADDGSTAGLALRNAIPEADLQQMIETWNRLQPNRKALQKERASNAPSIDSFALLDTKAYHKTKCKGVVALATRGHYVVTAGTDRQLVVYDSIKREVVQTMTAPHRVQALDVHDSVVLVGDKTGLLTAYGLLDGAVLGSVPPPEGSPEPSIVDVRLHPDGAHALVAFAKGEWHLVSLTTFSVISVFAAPEGTEPSQYSCAVLHPDGLIYLVGTTKGELVLWDLKNQALGATLSRGGEGEEAPGEMRKLAISENGYHIAAAHSNDVVLWDLRKQKQLAVVHPGVNELVDAVAFDDSGMYLAVGGQNGVRIVTVKAPNERKDLEGEGADGLRWIQSQLAVTSHKRRQVLFFGAAT